jgi:hypothetical protein
MGLAVSIGLKFCMVVSQRVIFHIPGARPKFLIRGLEMLGLYPEPDPFQMRFFACFEIKFLLKTKILVLKTIENSVCTSF